MRNSSFEGGHDGGDTRQLEEEEEEKEQFKLGYEESTPAFKEQIEKTIRKFYRKKKNKRSASPQASIHDLMMEETVNSLTRRRRYTLCDHQSL